jgi:CDP-glucose 4,6-dehydratase
MEGLGVKMFDFYKNKRIFVTGHTGFKGSWLCKILSMMDAEVVGFAKLPDTEKSLFNIINIENQITSIIGDIRDLGKLQQIINDFKPEIVFHLAAQPIVRESYRNPVYTYETNVMGTVNVLESIRNCHSVRSVVNVTTDKVYENNEWHWGYRENDRLDGFDPYSNSKSCSELVTNSYKKSFFNNKLNIGVSTARAGNVIGGGDFSIDRIIPDCIRAAAKKNKIILRNPNSIRPYQHVFEALSAYLHIAKSQYINNSIQDSYNIGPNDEDCITTGRLASIFCEAWGDITWESISEINASHESNFLKLDCSKIKNVLGWNQNMNIVNAVDLTVAWTKSYYNGEDMNIVSENQIKEYFQNTDLVVERY